MTAKKAQLQQVMAKPSEVQTFRYAPWTFASVKDHIMPSTCSCPPEQSNTCQVCQYEKSYAVLPEMVFATNSLSIQHDNGCCIRFDCRGALDGVDFTKSDDTIKVSASAEWQASRQELTQSMPKAQDFDWTFGTKYMGDITGFQVVEAGSSDRIDLDKLRQREPIQFYEELSLFEDELSDHGCALMSIRCRVMPSGYFVLLRYYLRVDGVMVRLYDTRFYWEQGSAHVIREWTHRQARLDELDRTMRMAIMQPDQCWQSLPVKEEKIQLLKLQ